MPALLESIATATVMIAAPRPIGTINGYQRLVIDIIGGQFTGLITGEVLPGGADWPKLHANGAAIVSAAYAVQTSDGTVIRVFNDGAVQAFTPSAPIWTVPRFEAPDGEFSWLNFGAYIGLLHPSEAQDRVHLEFFRAKLADPE